MHAVSACAHRSAARVAQLHLGLHRLHCLHQHMPGAVGVAAGPLQRLRLCNLHKSWQSGIISTHGMHSDDDGGVRACALTHV